jgi:hypothetical protein
MNRVTTENTTSLQQDVSRLWTHLVDLGALQCRLFAVEFRRSSASLQKAVLLTITGGVLLLSAVPLLLFAAAMQLDAMTELTLPVALAIVAVIALLPVWPALAVAHRLTRDSAKELASPVRDLEINLRSLAGDVKSATHSNHNPNGPYSSGPYSNGTS